MRTRFCSLKNKTKCLNLRLKNHGPYIINDLLTNNLLPCYEPRFSLESFSLSVVSTARLPVDAFGDETRGVRCSAWWCTHVPVAAPAPPPHLRVGLGISPPPSPKAGAACEGTRPDRAPWATLAPLAPRGPRRLYLLMSDLLKAAATVLLDRVRVRGFFAAAGLRRLSARAAGLHPRPAPLVRSPLGRDRVAEDLPRPSGGRRAR